MIAHGAHLCIASKKHRQQTCLGQALEVVGVHSYRVAADSASGLIGSVQEGNSSVLALLDLSKSDLAFWG